MAAQKMMADAITRLVAFAEREDAEVTIAREPKAGRPLAPMPGGQWAVMLRFGPLMGRVALEVNDDLPEAAEAALNEVGGGA